MTRLKAIVISAILAELDRQDLTLGQLAESAGMAVSVLDHKLYTDGVLDLDDVERIGRALGVAAVVLMSNEPHHQRNRTNGGPIQHDVDPQQG